MVELIPGVSRNVWRDNDPQLAAADAEYRAKRPGALVRHKNTCQGCGVQSVDGMEVHHHDCNHANNSDENLTPECVTCHPVNHIGELASRHTRADRAELAGGFVRLSYLPDISQADLSHLFRTIGHVMNNGNDEDREEAAQLYEQIASYSQYVESAWGTSKASHFAVAMKECHQDVYEARAESMSGVRVVFTLDAIKQLASRFAKEFNPLPMAGWRAIFEQRRPKVSAPNLG